MILDRGYQLHLYPGSELAVIEGAGHTMIGEKPAETHTVILEFLKRE